VPKGKPTLGFLPSGLSGVKVCSRGGLLGLSSDTESVRGRRFGDQLTDAGRRCKVSSSFDVSSRSATLGKTEPNNGLDCSHRENTEGGGGVSGPSDS
jgi:hypothetical protein